LSTLAKSPHYQQPGSRDQTPFWEIARLMVPLYCRGSAPAPTAWPSALRALRSIATPDAGTLPARSASRISVSKRSSTRSVARAKTAIASAQSPR